MISISPLTSSLSTAWCPFSSLNGGGHFKIVKLCVENSAWLPYCVFSIGIPKLAPSHSVFFETLKSVSVSQHLKVCCAVGEGAIPCDNFHIETVCLYIPKTFGLIDIYVSDDQVSKFNISFKHLEFMDSKLCFGAK